MFRGANTLTLDAKGRMTIPSRYRELLQEACQGRLVITRDHRARCLLVYPQAAWITLEQRLAALPNFDGVTRELQRIFIGFATDCDVDGQGRVLLPPALREYAGLDRRVMMIGQVNKFELWDEQAWNEHCTGVFSEKEAESQMSDFLRTLSL